MGLSSANVTGRRIPGGLASVTVSDVPTSTVIDYERTYLCGRGVLRFSGQKVYPGQALTNDQLRKIARPEGFLSTGRIYPAPAGWTAPESEPITESITPPITAGEPVIAPPALVTPADDAAAVTAALAANGAPTPAEQELAAQNFVQTPEGTPVPAGEAQVGDKVIFTTNPPESPVAVAEAQEALADATGAQAQPQPQGGADDGDGWQDDDVDDPFVS